MKDNIKFIGKKAGVLSLVELGLGSFLHSIKFPMTGYFLSLNQSLVLTKSTLESAQIKEIGLVNRKSQAFNISTIVALLKTLSPAGKKLTPMLAISVQGLLFSLGLFIGGINYFGLILAGILLSLWSFIQPFMIYYVLFGDQLFNILIFFEKKLLRIIDFNRQELLLVFCIYISLKLILSIMTTLLAYKISPSQWKNYQDSLIKIAKRKKVNISKQNDLNIFILTLKDLFNPMFIFSMLLTCIFYIYVEGPNVKVIWPILRPIAIGFILFFIIRFILSNNNVNQRLKKRFKKTFLILEEASKLIQK
jgi:hypothetical protein